MQSQPAEQDSVPLPSTCMLPSSLILILRRLGEISQLAGPGPAPGRAANSTVADLHDNVRVKDCGVIC